jgi:hypothetical protein
LTRADLVTLDEQDIRASSVFDDDAGENGSDRGAPAAPGNVS